MSATNPPAAPAATAPKAQRGKRTSIIHHPDTIQELRRTFDQLVSESDAADALKISKTQAHHVLEALKIFQDMVNVENVEPCDDELDDVTRGSLFSEYSNQSQEALNTKKLSTKKNWSTAFRKVTIKQVAEHAVKDAENGIMSGEYVKGIQRAILMTIANKDLAYEAAKKLVTLGNWDFSMHDLASVTGAQTLPAVAMTIFDGISNVIEELNVNLMSLCHYISHISGKYVNNHYHNSLHGADVGQSVYHFLRQKKWGDHFTPVETFGTIIASFVHDVGHTGVNNAYLVKTMDPLALKYNDQSPLENMHIAIAWEGIQEPHCNFLSKMSPDHAKRFRQVLVKTVLGTDNALHFEHVNKLKELVLKGKTKDDRFTLGDLEHRDLMLQLILHAADLSNPTKPMPVYSQWCDAIMEEFYELGDLENKAGLPVTHIFKRETPKADVQIGFIKFLVRPFFQALKTVDGMEDGVTVMLKNIEDNLKHWEAEKEKEKEKAPAEK
jgi:hypothetical protein